jgi:hypothetical protein
VKSLRGSKQRTKKGRARGGKGRRVCSSYQGRVFCHVSVISMCNWDEIAEFGKNDKLDENL